MSGKKSYEPSFNFMAGTQFEALLIIESPLKTTK